MTDDSEAPDDATVEARELADLVHEHADTQAFLRDDIVRAAAAGVTPEKPFGVPGRPMSQRSPFYIAFVATFGVAAALLICEAVIRAWGVLILILVAAFFAVGLDPVVGWLTDRGWRRGLAVGAVLLVALGILGLFVATAVPAITTEYNSLHKNLPEYLHRLQHRHDSIGNVARKVHLSSDQISKALSYKGVVSLSKTILSTVVTTLTIVVLTCYFLANLPALKRSAYRLVPRSRRARVGLLSDEILRLVGGYLLGNLITSMIAGGAMAIFLFAMGVPDAVFLGLLVALFDLIPMIGAPIAGVIVALIALSVSLPTAIATVAFTIVFRLVEDYLLSPRVMKKTVEVAPILTVVSVLIGGALLGIVGALIAVPVAAALDLIRREVFQPSLDQV
ncbi:MAG: AI-2E family transporter [Frankiaceae bacterium]|nr:AI-2E family transporter [Frankiaceae bacterium]MBV9368774.1 AI-2E family transporter [Frankiales bacterium]